MIKLPSVLLVDDDPTTNFLNRIVLEELRVADQVVEKDNGLTALEYVKSNCINDNASRAGCPDLILLDINMPVMDGFGFLEAFQQMPRVRKDNISVVMLTSSSNRKDMERAHQYNIAGYLDKPLTEEKIKSLADMKR